jgi:hypothetical protein
MNSNSSAPPVDNDEMKVDDHERKKEEDKQQVSMQVDSKSSSVDRETKEKELFKK